MTTATSSHTIATLETSLRDMADVFGVSFDEMPNSERHEGLELIKTYTGSEFEQLFSPDRLDSWFDAFSTDLTLTVDVLDTGVQTTLRPGTSGQMTFVNVLETIAKYTIERITVTAVIEKYKVLESLSKTIGFRLAALYFFSSTLEKRLTLDGLQSLHAAGILSDESHSVIGVLFARGLVRGRCLTVLGLGDDASGIEFQSSQRRRQAIMWGRIRAIRDANSTWHDSLSGLDPGFGQVEIIGTGMESVAYRLLGASDILSYLQFATSIVRRGDALIARFSKPGGVVWEVSVSQLYSNADAPSTQVPTPAFQLLRWGYQGEDYDKIDIVRDRVDRELHGTQGELASHLIQSAPEIHLSARATYKALRERAFESFMKARQEAEAKVAAAVSGYRTNIDKLRTDMLTRVLQFFTAIAAFLAVSVLQPNLPNWIKAFGLGSAIIFVCLVIGFQLFPAYQDFRQQCAEANRMVDGYDNLLSTVRDQIKSSLPSGRWNVFTIWLALCTGVYLLELLGFAIALCVVLGHT